MPPLTRLVTVGPVAAFGTKAAFTAETPRSRRWPGGRRLLSVEDSTVVLSGANNELDQWPDQSHGQRHTPENS